MHLEKRRVEAILVHQVSDWGSGTAGYFGLDARRSEPDWRLEGEYPLWSLTDERSRGRGTAGQKTRSPEGCDENGPAAALLLSHVSIKICSFIVPCRRSILIATPLPRSLTWCTSARFRVPRRTSAKVALALTLLA